ncbi:MAG: DNA (cytosine-5-)-methyltransferase [Microcystis aeruginosa W13-18]|jgi:DNA (cytosine-5)-methyltransferase 1|nr:DNA (cytosine-5-)-methyltransferase [Microcystis aeruginosa W13-18]
MTQVNLQKAANILRVTTAEILTWQKKKLIKGQKINQVDWLFNLDELTNFKNNQSPRELIILQTVEPTNYTVLELFAGCGGMALGLENAGLKTQLMVEINQDCVNTLRLNRPQWNVINQDIKKIKFSDFRDKIDIVAGGFPCQPFSYAGLGKGLEDLRGSLFFEFARCLQEVQPKIAMAENVRGLLSNKKGETLQLMLQALQEIGYYAAYQVLSAQFLDVPQKRERLIIIATRQDLNIKPIFPQYKNYTISLKKALENCPSSLGVEYKERKKEIMSLVPAGGNWRNLPMDIQKEYMKNSLKNHGGRTGYAKRLSWDEPALTITCSPAQTQTERCHPQETRPLTVREYARVQSFPDDWQFTGNLTSQYRQIGNAVPVNMAYHLGGCLINMLQGDYIGETQPKTEQLSIPGLEVN